VIERIDYHTARGVLHVPRSRVACDLWLGNLNNAGYPHVYWTDENGVDRHLTVGMAQWKLAQPDGQGVVPKNSYICHSCDVKSCVNPEHLYLGTGHMNASDRRRRGSSREQGVLSAEVLKQLELRRGHTYTNTPLWLKRQAAALFSFHPLFGFHTPSRLGV
jgi:hypothetical protein